MMVDHLFAIANEFSINLIIFFAEKSALITIELLDWMMMSLAFRKDHGCLMHQQNVSNCITFCSKSHTARMGKCLAMNFFPPRLPFHSLWNSFSNFWLHEITDPIDCYWITQIGIFSSISSGGIFVFISRLFTCKQSFFSLPNIEFNCFVVALNDFQSSVIYHPMSAGYHTIDE